MSILQRYYRWRFGHPAPGEIIEHERLTYPFETGAEAIRRIEGIFGPSASLCAADLGCGPATSHIANQIISAPWKRLISVEAFPPYAAQLRLRKAAAADHLLIEERIEQFARRLHSHDVDIAIMVDVLEHFPKRKAFELLLQLERGVKRGIVLFLPLGRVEQEEYDQNPLQRHWSFWESSELAAFGYNISLYRGLHGQLNPPADAGWAIKRIS